MSEKDTLEDASDGSDATGDEINQKVLRVMAPLLKKIQRQTKRVSLLEENVQREARDTAARLEPLERGLEAQRTSMDEERARMTVELGGRAAHSELARVEAASREAESSLRTTLEDARAKVAASEMILGSVQGRLGEVEAAERRTAVALDDRAGALRASMEQHTSSTEARRSEMQLHLSEVEAKLQGELGAFRLGTQAALGRLDERVGASARRAELDERSGALQQSHAALAARCDRQAAQLGAMQAQLSELQQGVAGRASRAEVDELRATLSDGADRTAGAAHEVASAAQERADAREQRHEQRQRALEAQLASSQREVRQLAANLDDLGARLGECARVAELAPLREALGGLDGPAGYATASSVASLRERLDAMAPLSSREQPRNSIDELKRMATLAAETAQVVSETVTAQLRQKGDAEAVRRNRDDIARLARALDGKMGADEARALLQHKADGGALQRQAQHAERATALALATQARLEAAEEALGQAGREAAAAVEQARLTQAALVQMQAAGERHWQATRTTRDEHAQLVKAVRALLMDAEMRVAAEEGADHRGLGAAGLDLSHDQYGQHGWSTASGKPPRSGSRRLGSGGGAPLPPSPPSPLAAGAPPDGSDGGGLLSRRRRMLARSSLADAPSLDVTTKSALSSAGGRTRVAHNLNWASLGP